MADSLARKVATPKRVLDLFCGAGGAAMGLHWAWPDAEIVGVDIKPQPRYPFTFVQMDWLEFLKCYTDNGLSNSFDFAWASPPCQRYSVVTPRGHRAEHPDYICSVRSRLIPPFVIENVMGAKKHFFDDAFMLCGSMFGLRTRRHRIFEVNGFECKSPRKCDHSERPLLVTTAGANSRKIGNYKSVKNAKAAYDIEWMDGEGLKQAIPPAYSQYIAGQFTESLCQTK